MLGDDRMRIGLMVWEIGDRGFLAQFEWAAANGFEAVAFHTNPLLAPRRGIDPETMTPQDWARLKSAVKPFAETAVHAPFDHFDLALVSPNERVRRASIAVVGQSLEAASRLRAATVTIHRTATRSGIPAAEQQRLLVESLLELDGMASALGVRVGLEATEDFGIFERVQFQSVGVTIDVGHLSFHDGRAWKPWGSLGGLIRGLGRHIVHVHVHDYDGEHDHLSLGKGRLDFAEIVGALRAVRYKGTLCLELAPTTTIEADYRASRDLLRKLTGMP